MIQTPMISTTIVNDHMRKHRCIMCAVYVNQGSSRSNLNRGARALPGEVSLLPTPIKGPSSAVHSRSLAG